MNVFFWKFLNAILLSLILTNVSANEVRKPLTIAYYSLPPHAMSYDGIASGAAVRYLSNVVFPSNEYKLTWTFYPFARVLEQLKEGSVDAGILIAKTEARSQIFKFPKGYLYETKSGLVTHSDFNITQIKRLDQLKGFKLGHVTNSVRPQVLEDAGVIFEDLSGEGALARNITKLNHRRIDGVYLPNLSHGKYQLNKLPETDQLIALELPVPGYKLYTVFRRDIDPSVIDPSVIDTYDKNSSQKDYLHFLQMLLEAN